MGFAGGLWVFPGGRVDDGDRDPGGRRELGRAVAGRVGRAAGPPSGRRGGSVVAACRETLEEAGLLLASPAPDAGELEAARRELLAGSAGFAELLARLGVRLDAGRLRYWAWWVTPEIEPRRYDTRFFVAGLPDDAVVTAHLAEVERERWPPPAEAAADQDLPMLPRPATPSATSPGTAPWRPRSPPGRSPGRAHPARARRRRPGHALGRALPGADPTCRPAWRPVTGHGSPTDTGGQVTDTGARG